MDATDEGFAVEPMFAWPAALERGGVTAGGHVFGLWPLGATRLRFVWDGAAGVPFDGFLTMRDGTSLFRSSDQAHLAFVGIRDRKPFVCRDGREDRPFDEFSRSVPPVFSADGSHLAYGAATNGEFRLIIDGRVVGEGSLAPIEAVFSPVGERLAYAEIRTDPVEHRIVLDGVAGPWFHGMRNAVGAMQFSPDGQRFAFYRTDGKGHAQWVVDGDEHPLVNDTRPIGLAQVRGVGVLDPPLPALFSPDSRRFAYWADILEKGVAICEDGVPGDRYQAAGVPVFSPDSRQLAYVGKTFGRQVTLVLDGATVLSLPATDDAGVPVFSRDSRHVVCTHKRVEGGLFRKRRLYGVALDDVAFRAHEGDDASARAAISPDGARVAWWLKRGSKGVLMVNGDPAGSEADVRSDTFFTASGRLVCAGLLGRSSTIFADGRPGPLADDALDPAGPPALAAERGASFPFRTSADGDHVAWAGLFAGQARPVLDDRVGPAFDHVLDWSIGEDGTATWLAMRGAMIQRVTAAVR